MGYTTNFDGSFELKPTLSEAHRNYIKAFGDTRRMQRDPKIAETLPDPLRKLVSLPIGDEGCYFVGAGGYGGQDDDDSILDYNNQPSGQPGLWCQWTPNDDGTEIQWDGSEKFYNYVEWLKYLIVHFLAPWGYELNGEVMWDGEDQGDTGTIVVTKNDVKVRQFGKMKMARRTDG